MKSQCGAYLSNYGNLQLKSLLHLGKNVITFRTLHLGSFIIFRRSTTLSRESNDEGVRTQQRFMRGAAAPRSNPLRYYIPFLGENVPLSHTLH